MHPLSMTPVAPRRRSSDNDLMRGLPTWAKVLMMVGIPGILAYWLTFQITTTFAQNQIDIVDTLEKHIEIQTQTDQRVRELLIHIEQHRLESERTLSAMKRYLRVICRSSANTREDERLCNEDEP